MQQASTSRCEVESLTLIRGTRHGAHRLGDVALGVKPCGQRRKPRVKLSGERARRTSGRDSMYPLQLGPLPRATEHQNGMLSEGSGWPTSLSPYEDQPPTWLLLFPSRGTIKIQFKALKSPSLKVPQKNLTVLRHS